jgi:hypothetical protein
VLFEKIDPDTTMADKNETTPKITIDFRVVDYKYNSSKLVMTKVFLNGSEIFQPSKTHETFFELKDGKFQTEWSQYRIEDMCKSLEQYQFRWIDIGKEPVVFTYTPCKKYENGDKVKYGDYSAVSDVYGEIQVTVCLNWVRAPTIYFQR